MADGLLGKCKACTRGDVRENRARNVDRFREYDRQRYYEGGDRRVAPRDPEVERAAKRRWLNRNKDKRRAHSAVNNAIRDGKLQRAPCVRCGTEPAEAHHPDYTRKLDVVWLCSAHHALVHREERDRKRKQKQQETDR